MRVLQTLGSHQGLPTAFYYGRTSHGVIVQQIRGQAPEHPWVIPHSAWEAMLGILGDFSNSTFAVTDRHENPQASNANLYEVLHSALTQGGVSGVSDSLLAYVSAILVHEGSLLLYHGKIGADREARVVLRRPW